MSPLQITQLIIALGPPAISLIEKLTDLWGKETLTPDEVKDLCSVYRKGVDDYLTEARTLAAAKLAAK